MKTNQLVIAITVTVFGLSVPTLFFSCKNSGEKAGEKAVENAIENASGEEADVNMKDETVEVTMNEGKIRYDGNIKSWPDEIPDEIPEFTYGKIDGATISDVDDKIAYTFKILDIDVAAMKAYDKDLKAKGFESMLILMGEKGGSITAEKEGLSVALMGGEGNGSLSVQIPKK